MTFDQIVAECRLHGRVTLPWAELRPLFPGLTDADRWRSMVRWSAEAELLFSTTGIDTTAQGEIRTDVTFSPMWP